MGIVLPAQRPAVGGDPGAARARGRHRRGGLRQDHADGGAGGLPRAHRPGASRGGAGAHLHHQGRQRAAPQDPRRPGGRGRAAARRASSGDPDDEPLEPTVATYNAYAATLLTEHGLRIGHEPDTRVVTDAARYQLGARVVARFTGEVAPPHRPPRDRHPEPARPRRRDERAPGGHRRRARRSTPRPASGSCERSRRRSPARTAPPTASRARRRSSRSTAAPSCSHLVRDYRRLKRELGLMDFSDQIELGARLAREQPEVGAAERERFRVVLLDEYQDTSVAQAVMLSRLFGRRARRHGGRRPQPGHLRLAGRVGLQHPRVRRGLPRAVGRARAAPPHGQPPLRPAHPRGRQPSSRSRCTTRCRRSSRSSRLPRAGRASSARACTRPTPTSCAWLTSAVDDAHTGDDGGRWSDIAVLTRDNAHAEDVFDALTAAGIPVEIVGLSGLLRLPEVAEVVATLRLLHDVTANAAHAHPPHRPPVGGRPARPAAAGQARPADRRPAAGSRRGGGDRGRCATSWSRIADGIDPAEVPALDDALADPGPLPLLRGRARAVRPARRRAAPAAPPRGRAAARRRAADPRDHRRRRRARLGGQPGRGRPPRQPRPVREGGRRLPGRRRRRHPAGPAGLPHRRGRPGQRPRRRHPHRGRLGQAAHRPPRQGSGVGDRLPGGRGRGPVPLHPVAHALDVLAGGAARTAARRRRRPAPARRPRQGRPRRLPARHPCPRRPRGAAARLRRRHPRRAPARRSPRTAGGRGSRRMARRRTRRSCAE